MSDSKGQRIRSGSFAYKLLELSFHRKRHQKLLFIRKTCSGYRLLPRLMEGWPWWGGTSGNRCGPVFLAQPTCLNVIP